MSLRRRLLQVKADREKWENRLALAVAVFFAGAIVCNLRLFFSVCKTPSFFGAAFSWLYAASWLPAAVLLRRRAEWLRAAWAVRWAAVGCIILGIAASAGGGMGVFSAVCVMPYAVFTSVYAGLAPAAWMNYGLPLAQAVVVTVLFRRLRRGRS